MGATPPAPPPPPLSPLGSQSERAALSRDLADFLIELSIALHKHAMYPEGHPSLLPAAITLKRRADLLLEHRSTISLGVARRQLVIEGVATDPKHPVLRELAERLHRHHLGAITVSRGVEVDELRNMLATLALEAERTGAPLGLGPAEGLRRWAHVRLHALTYDRLELIDETAAAPTAQDEEKGAARARAAELWVGLARVALAAESADAPPPSTEPSVIAKAIDERATGPLVAYDQAIVGYLLQIAEELKSAGAAEAVPLRRRMARLIGSLKPETLRRLLTMGGDLAQRRKFVADAADGMALDSVLEIVQAAAATSDQTVSHALMRMLSKFAIHAEAGTDEARPQAEDALRQQVRSLLEGWNLADPNPTAYGAALQRMAGAGPLFVTPADRLYAAEPDRLAAMGLELDLASDLVLESVDRLVAEGRVRYLFDALEQVGESPATSRVWGRIATVDVVSRLAHAEPLDFPALERVALRVGPEAAEPLLDLLASAESRSLRRGFLGVLVRLGHDIVPLIGRRLYGDVEQIWYVTRNLLTILDELREIPPGGSLARFTTHADSRVRWQALKLQLKIPAERERALEAALQDTDERIVRLGLAAAPDGLPERLIPLIVAAVDSRARGPELRVAAIRALGSARAVPARDALLRLTDGGRSLFGRAKLPAKSPELIAALGALAVGWCDDTVARRVLQRAARSEDADVRAAARGPDLVGRA